MVDIASIDFLRITPIWGKRALSDRLLVKKEPIGVLNRERLPFFIDPPQNTEPGKAAKLFKKILPKTLGNGLFDANPPLGWRLSISHSLPKQNILMPIGALMTVEIRRW
jgi:hypothetical protein